jgi:hypothetical protein
MYEYAFFDRQNVGTVHNAQLIHGDMFRAHDHIFMKITIKILKNIENLHR